MATRVRTLSVLFTITFASSLRWAKKSASVQLDLTYPIHRHFFHNTHVDLQAQYVSILAERLLSYQERTEGRPAMSGEDARLLYLDEEVEPVTIPAEAGTRGALASVGSRAGLPGMDVSLGECAGGGILGGRMRLGVCAGSRLLIGAYSELPLLS